MKDAYLSFEDCISHLKHSFLRVVHQFSDEIIDFQHPSIRDMLLDILQNEPRVRRQYISNVSATGLSELIEGVSLFGYTLNKKEHRLILRNEEELLLLCERIKVVVKETILDTELERILYGALSLVPKKGTNKMNPGEMDLGKFSETPSGLVLKTILSTFVARETYNSKTTYSFSSWVSILKIFYKLAPYVSPVLRPVWIRIVLQAIKSKDIHDAIKLIHCLKEKDPSMFGEIFNKDLDKYWNNEMIALLDKSIEAGEEHESLVYSNYEEEVASYEEWLDKAEEILESANMYYSFSEFKKPKEISILKNLINNISSPEEPPEDDYIMEEDKEEEYWTVDNLFQDL